MFIDRQRGQVARKGANAAAGKDEKGSNQQSTDFSAPDFIAPDFSPEAGTLSA
jgi:hypothetical protein